MKRHLLFTFLISPAILFGQTYNNIESTEYDPVNNRFLTSNGSSIIAQDADGNLSFFGSASANYGMEVMGDYLFAIKSSQIKAYDLSNGDEAMSVTIAGAGFLNGMANDGSSRIWVTDFGADKIYEIDVSDMDNPSYAAVVDDTGVTPNGILYDEPNDRLLFVAWYGNAAITEVSLPDYQLNTIINTGLSNIDGIDDDGLGNYYISSWSPTRITRYNSDFSESEIISAPGLSNPADISYGKEIHTLGIPNSGNNTVTLVEFGDVGQVENIEDPFNMSLTPNPLEERSVLTFNLNVEKKVFLDVINQQGEQVVVLLDESAPQGVQRVLMAGLGLESGYYICRLKAGDTISALPFLVK